MTPQELAALTPQELVARYQALGMRLVHWERRGQNPRDWKGPSGKDAIDWNAVDKVYPVEQFDPSHMNLGVFTGHEIQPGKFLADVDFDWAEGLQLVPYFIPTTCFAFGREGKKISHIFFTTSERVGITQYYDISEEKNWSGNGITFVELRGGDSTHQTMVAPSLHSPGTHIELAIDDGGIPHVATEDLKETVIDYAIACLLLNHVRSGLHHEGRIALIGYLLRLGLGEKRTQRIVESVCKAQIIRGVKDMTDKDVHDVSLVLRTTLNRLNSDKKIAGGPKLAEFIGGAEGKGVIARIAKYVGKQDEFIRNAAGIIIPKNQHNIRRAIELLGHKMSYNVFAEQILIDDKPLEDPQWKGLYLDIEEQYRFQPPPDYFKIVIEDLAWRNRFHPVKDYLDTLSWDGKPRIDQWIIISAGAEDTPYVRAVSSIMLVAAVRRIRQPGAKYDEMVVWESSQGTNKSSAAQALCPNTNWFSDDLQLNLKSKELIEATLGKWIVEASDLAGKRKTEIEQLKAMMSRQTDGPARMAYAHFPVQRPRHFILIGTTNSSVYLTDPTGARRFWPIAVKRFNVDWINKHRDQLWAEACVRDTEGMSIRLDEDLWPEAAKLQEKRREVDPWETTLRSILANIQPASDNKRRIVTEDLWMNLGIAMDRRDRYGALRIAEIMQRLGFRRTTVRGSNGDVQGGYVSDRPELLDLDAEEEHDDGTPRPNWDKSEF